MNESNEPQMLLRLIVEVMRVFFIMMKNGHTLCYGSIMSHRHADMYAHALLNKVSRMRAKSLYGHASACYWIYVWSFLALWDDFFSMRASALSCLRMLWRPIGLLIWTPIIIAWATERSEGVTSCRRHMKAELSCRAFGPVLVFKAFFFDGGYTPPSAYARSGSYLRSAQERAFTCPYLALGQTRPLAAYYCCRGERT